MRVLMFSRLFIIISLFYEPKVVRYLRIYCSIFDNDKSYNLLFMVLAHKYSLFTDLDLLYNLISYNSNVKYYKNISMIKINNDHSCIMIYNYNVT